MSKNSKDEAKVKVDGKDAFYIPIIAHKSNKTLFINSAYFKKIGWVDSFDNLEKHSWGYSIFLIKMTFINGEEIYLAKMLIESNPPSTPICSLKSFKADQRKDICEYLSAPLRMFCDEDGKRPHVDVLLFEGKPMSESDTEKQLKEWMRM
jgi:hypothetical protein